MGRLGCRDAHATNLVVSVSAVQSWCRRRRLSLASRLRAPDPGRGARTTQRSLCLSRISSYLECFRKGPTPEVDDHGTTGLRRGLRRVPGAAHGQQGSSARSSREDLAWAILQARTVLTVSTSNNRYLINAVFPASTWKRSRGGPRHLIANCATFEPRAIASSSATARLAPVDLS